MNFYKHFLGDYARDTAHLSMLEHGAYRLMLDHYYATGKSLPSDKVLLYRVCKASSKTERAAVDLVAEAFFPVNGDGTRHNQRADMELADATLYEGDAETRRKNERERQKRHRELRRGIFETLRERGIIPAFNATTEELYALLNRDGHAPVTRDDSVAVTSTATASHSHSHKELKQTKAPPPGFDFFYLPYPRKVGRPSALRAWNKLNPDALLAEKIAAVVVATKWPDEMKFIPHPATYLNDRRWEDVGAVVSPVSLVKRAAF